MNKDVIILLVEDDDGHATLIERNLKRAGIANRFQRFVDGQSFLDFLFGQGTDCRCRHTAYVLLLDIRLPDIQGDEILRQLKSHPELRKMPVVMLTTTDDPREVEACHRLGCSHYVTKPVLYDDFVEVIRRLGLFWLIIQVPILNGVE